MVEICYNPMVRQISKTAQISSGKSDKNVTRDNAVLAPHQK